MREELSKFLVSQAKADRNFVVLSGDHGYALFDGIRREAPSQFLNVGVSEQAMVGYAAGLASLGYRPVVYGLAAFVPVRVLEQIKLDVCFSKRPVIFLGDGAGLVYSTLGASHQCAEDMAALRSVAHIRVYSPAQADELIACLEEAYRLAEPAYIRIGKSDRAVISGEPLQGTEPRWIRRGGAACLVATGSMVSVASSIGEKLGLSVVSVPRIKPFASSLAQELSGFKKVFVLEEHSKFGGLFSSIAEAFAERGGVVPKVHSLSLEDQFSQYCGSYQYALSEHRMDDAEVMVRISEMVR